MSTCTKAQSSEATILNTGLQHITLKQALNVASEHFKTHLSLEKPTNWNDFIDAAYKRRKELNISQSSWANACLTLERTGAAICLLLTDQGIYRESNCISNPAAYFNAMIHRAKKGELRLHNSIFSILKQEGNLA